VHHPLDRIAEEMVRLLTDVVAGRTPLSITVPTTLVLRESSPAGTDAARPDFRWIGPEPT
jgi:DNA-binding LacI/PurR family transcriptional regulator